MLCYGTIEASIEASTVSQLLADLEKNSINESETKQKETSETKLNGDVS